MHPLTVLQTVGLVGFWLSITFIGDGLLLLLQQKIASYLKEQSFVVSIFISTALGVTAVGLIFLPAYIFSLPLAFVEVGYFGLCLASFIVFVIHRKRLWKQLRPTSGSFVLRTSTTGIGSLRGPSGHCLAVW